MYLGEDNGHSQPMYWARMTPMLLNVLCTQFRRFVMYHFIFLAVGLS